jgi:hypothetical protein
MVVKIKLTDDILALVSNIHFGRLPDVNTITKAQLTWGIDFFSLYGGSFALEDISYIIGKYNEHIPGTEEDPMGPRFPKELEDYMWEIHTYIVDNIEYIEDLVHYYSNKGGLKKGTYKCKDYNKVWEYIGEK